VLGTSAALLGAQGPPPTFRGDTDAVTVNVSVKKGNTPVPGLTAADFRLYDNEILQPVSAVSLDAVPVVVSIVVDTSLSAFEDLESARDGVRGMIAFLRPSDRVRVLTMGNSVISAIPWQSPTAPDTSRIQVGPGEISLVADSVLIALFHRTPPDRRHLVVALTDAQDVCSLVSGDSLRRSAERSGAVLHWIDVKLKPSVGRSGTRNPTDGLHSYCMWANGGGAINMRPFFTEAVNQTGGTTHTAWYSEDRVVVDAFDRIFDDFRRSYVLHYVSRGVERTGWHRLRVEMVSRGYTVRARPGYWGPGASGVPK
jgi:VWFA-related protein